jgi:hypothetical protein
VPFAALNQFVNPGSAMMRRPKSGGGWKAIAYTMRLANRVGWWKLWKAMRSRNTCKTCALDMGGQLGGMVNEGGYFPEVCARYAIATILRSGLRLPSVAPGLSLVAGSFSMS